MLVIAVVIILAYCSSMIMKTLSRGTWDGKWDTDERTCTGLVNTSSVERYGEIAIMTTWKLAL